MGGPWSNEEPDPETEELDLDRVGRAERLLRKGRVSTPDGVRLVADRYGLRSIPTLIQSLASISPKTRESAFQALQAFGDPGFRRLLKAVTEGSVDQRLAAVTYLGAWGDPRAVETLLFALKHNEGESKRKKLTIAIVLIAVVVVVLALLTGTGGACGDCCNCGCGGCGEGSCFACEETDDIRLRRQTVKSLAQIGDLRAIGAMARLRLDKDSTVARTARESLSDLLTKVAELREEEAAALGPDGILELAAALSQADDNMAWAILAAFRAVGDAYALPAVDRLARDFYRDRALCAEAQALQPLIKERIAREETRMTLLRAADPNMLTSSTELLRPVQEQVAAEPPEQLLRAGNDSHEEQNQGAL